MNVDDWGEYYRQCKTTVGVVDHFEIGIGDHLLLRLFNEVGWALSCLLVQPIGR